MRSMRARTVLLLTLPFLLLSETLGHAVVARTIDPGAARHHLLVNAAGDYLEYGRAALVVFLALVGAVLVRRALASSRGAGPQPLPAWRLAAVPALVFLLQEHFEHLLQDGRVHWLTSLEPAVLAGIALQIPRGLLALGLIRSLLRAADELGFAIARGISTGPRRRLTCAGLVTNASPLRLRVLASGHAGRAPPACA
jgi:hypothetical protein